MQLKTPGPAMLQSVVAKPESYHMVKCIEYLTDKDFLIMPNEVLLLSALHIVDSRVGNSIYIFEARWELDGFPSSSISILKMKLEIHLAPYPF